MALFLILTIQLAVLLPPVPHFLAVLVGLQPVFQLLGTALLLGSRVPFFLLLVQRLKLTFEGVIAWAGRPVGVRQAPDRDNPCPQPTTQRTPEITATRKALWLRYTLLKTPNVSQLSCVPPMVGWSREPMQAG